MPPARRPSRSATAAASLVLALALGACGSDDSTSGSSDTARDGAVATGVRTVPAPDAVQAAAEQGVVVIDVRTPEEFAAGHLEQARNLPLGEAFSEEIGALPRNGRYLLYCRTGNRSGQAARVMEQLGFTDVLDGGGLSSLEAAGADVVTG